MNITDFLEARITEDEAHAAQAQGEHYGWIDYWRVTDTRQGTRTESVIYAHAFRFDPSRVLAECAAKRAIIELAQKAADTEKEYDDYEWQGTVKSAEPLTGDAILCAIATVYKDHPDYQQDWAL